MNVCNDLQALSPAPGSARLFALKGTEEKAEAVAAPESQDQAHLSSAASLAGAAASLPDVRMEKVRAIQAAVADGSYRVSAEDVAQSLINHMLEGKQ